MAEEKELKEQKTKPSRKWIFWLVGCGCLAIILVFTLVFLSVKFYAGKKTTTPLPAFSSNLNLLSDETPTTVPDTRSCEQIDTPTSTALSISADKSGLSKNIENHTYNIYGTSENQLRQQMTKCGPKVTDGSFDALTNYYINWTYNYKDDGESCALGDVAVGAQIDIYLPKWDPPINMTNRLLDKWTSYYDALVGHENTHRDYDLDAASQILEALNNLGSFDSCDQAASTANSTGQQIIDQNNAINNDFDNATHHGMTTGAVFP